MTKLLTVIVACTENRVIGRDGKLPWRIPEDWKFFQEQTAGQVCVMGRICFESWAGAVRQGRRPIVVTQNAALAGPDRWIAPSLASALEIAEELPGEVFLCGGERIYAEALAGKRPLRLLLTLIHTTLPGDRYFPEWRHFPWKEVARREGSDTQYRYTFLTLERPVAATET